MNSKKIPKLEKSFYFIIILTVIIGFTIAYFHNSNEIEGNVIQKGVTAERIVHYESLTGTMPVTVFNERHDNKDFILIIENNGTEYTIFTDSVTWSNIELNDFIISDNEIFYTYDFNNEDKK